MNKINTWRQGKFIDSTKYSLWSDEEKQKANSHENLMVRPYPKVNAICICNNPDDAIWIAERLNLASNLEQFISNLTEKEIKDLDEIIKLINESKGK